MYFAILCESTQLFPVSEKSVREEIARDFPGVVDETINQMRQYDMRVTCPTTTRTFLHMWTAADLRERSVGAADGIFEADRAYQNRRAAEQRDQKTD